MSEEQVPVSVPSTDPFALAIPVSRQVQIRNIILSESASRRTSKAAAILDDFSPTIQIAQVHHVADREAKSLIVVVPLKLIVEEDGDKPIEHVRISATFILFYRVDSYEGIEEENLEAFASMNGVFNAWPYWREYVQSMAVRMGLPPIVVPVHRI
ncbi:hypothetical protein [Tautonia rosea]|uniref:hypothetical protein n=1 Tax=Tautonia rosea TaxID=2728037 RepID=UPI001472D4A3|nr:hypothetical protein [Tautonia rosea]